MVEYKVKIFLDESGISKEQKLFIMGALLIPTYVYESEYFKDIENYFKSKNNVFHWNKFSDSYKNKRDYTELLKRISPLFDSMRVNFICFHHSQLEKFGDELVSKMIYNKFPERVIYGLLRDNLSFFQISAEIYIEHCTNYEKIGLDKLIKEQLNIHSLYRSEPFRICNVTLERKNSLLGLQLIDTFLGIIRNILLGDDNSKRSQQKIKFIKSLFQEIYNLLPFFESFSLYEWKRSNKLSPVNIKKYIRLFLCK